MPCIGVGMCLVTVGLPCLCQKNERGGIRGLQTEHKIQQDEGIQVKLSHAAGIQTDPDGDRCRLSDKKLQCAEEARKGLGLESEPFVAEDGCEMNVR